MDSQRLSLPLVLALLLFSTAAIADEAPRSVVLIVIDSLRADHLQTYGYGRATSPEILAFSRNATVFTRAYPASNWTRPSIQALLTGRYPAELTSNPGGGSPLKDGHPTLGSALASYGYRTVGFYNTGQLEPAASNIGGFADWIDYGGTKGEDVAHAFVERGTQRTIDFLRDTRKPAFVFLHILDPHHPYLPSRNYFGKTPIDAYRDSWNMVRPTEAYSPDNITTCQLAKDVSAAAGMAELYDSEIREMDRDLGKLLHFLESDARYRNALVILTADHGEEFGEHGGFYHGARFFEESVRVPLIIRDPQRPYSRGRRVDSIVSLVDVAPTIINALGLPAENDTYSGRSLVEYLARRGGLPRETVFMDKPGCGYDGIVAVRDGDWKMIALRTRRKLELYNLRTDPAEKRDRAAEASPEVREELRRISGLYEAWDRRVTRPLPTRTGDVTPSLPPELEERLKALGYIDN
jgi:arylsulfatase A-like enzyme